MFTSTRASAARWAWLVASILGCSTPPDEEAKDAALAPSSSSPAVPCSPSDPACPSLLLRPTPVAIASCAAPVPIYEAGEPRGAVCAEQASALGLTVVDLSEDWAPRVFDGDEAWGPAPFRERFARTAREDFELTAGWDRERSDRYFELYGISPSFAVMRKRLSDEERHACHARLDDDGLRALAEPVDTWRARDKQRADRMAARELKNRLEADAILRGVTLDQLADDPASAASYRAYRRLAVRDQAVREMQNHLRCERLLGETADPGILDDATIEGMFGYFRKHMIVSWQLDDEVRRVMLTDSRELDFVQTLRTLRERVVDATGLIEDGTATGKPGLVAGRAIDTRVFAHVVGGAALANGADDLVARATDEAARALGFVDPGATLRRMSAALPPRVALRLSPPPAYHAKHMELVAVIDRGDVIYDPPNARPRPGTELARRERFPTMVLYAQDGDRQIPLVRWPTTIGGWQPESIPGRRVMLAYKESPRDRGCGAI